MVGQTVAELPLTTRNYTNLLGLSAGANVGVYNAAGLGRGTQDIAVNGGATTQNNFQMDGVSINLLSGSGSAFDFGGNRGLELQIRMRSRNSRSRPPSSMQAMGANRVPM
jgi:hypothetical protein